MENMQKTIKKQDVVFLSILIALCIILFFTLLGYRPLWDVDEGMHAATSKDMILSGDWITPQFNGKNFYDKPVLYLTAGHEQLLAVFLSRHQEVPGDTAQVSPRRAENRRRNFLYPEVFLSTLHWQHNQNGVLIL